VHAQVIEPSASVFEDDRHGLGITIIHAALADPPQANYRIIHVDNPPDQTRFRVYGVAFGRCIDAGTGIVVEKASV